MSLITPTFGDQNKKPELSPQGDTGNAPVHIVAPHEPTTANPFVELGGALPQPMYGIGPTFQMPVVPAAEPAPLKVALIGTAPSSRLLAPFNDPSWKIWACSPGNMNNLPRADVWFEIHANLLWPECKHYGEPYLKWLSELKIPLYMQDQSQVKNALIFPRDELIKEFGPYFFTSSFAWMLGFAMMQGAKEINLYGIDMASHDEYMVQRQGTQALFVEAAKRGIKCWAPPESDIMQPPGLYGYSDVTQFGRKTLARRAELQSRINVCNQELAQAQNVVASKTADLRYLQGALEDTVYYTEIHLGTQDNGGTWYLDQLLAKARNPEKQG
jgi:hypothetical protein